MLSFNSLPRLLTIWRVSRSTTSSWMIPSVAVNQRSYCSTTTSTPIEIGKKIILPLDPLEDVEHDGKVRGKTIVNKKASPMSSETTFSEIPELNPELVRRLESLGFSSPFEIQAKTLPHTLKGKDVIGRAVTGSGKTLAFAIPIIQKLMLSERAPNPRAIAIAPTRELCRQLMKHISVLSNEYRCVALYGGDSVARQERELHRGADVVCATPGRMNDHIQRGNLLLDDVEFVVLDEADELLTPNFKEQIENVLYSTPNKQMMLFSATMPRNIRQLIKEHMSSPVTVDLTEDNVLVPSSIKHQVMTVRPYLRDKVVVQLLKARNPSRAIVFTPTKIQASSLSRFLVRNGISATGLHSDLSQSIRDSCLQDFRDGRIKVIVATDVAARGIDIPEIELVIHCGPPPSGVDIYIHRSGRTGRKGNAGTSILLLSTDDDSRDFLYDMRRAIDFEFIDPPTYKEVIQVAISNAIKSIQGVDPELSNMVLKEAKELYEAEGIKALSSAMALLANLRTDEQNRFDRDGNSGYKHHSSGGYGRRDGSRDRYRGRDSRFSSRDGGFGGRDGGFSGKDGRFGGRDGGFGGRDGGFGGRDGRFGGRDTTGRDRRSNRKPWTKFYD